MYSVLTYVFLWSRWERGVRRARAMASSVDLFGLDANWSGSSQSGKEEVMSWGGAWDTAAVLSAIFSSLCTWWITGNLPLVGNRCVCVVCPVSRSPWRRGGHVTQVLPIRQHPKLLNVHLDPHSSLMFYNLYICKFVIIFYTVDVFVGLFCTHDIYRMSVCFSSWGFFHFIPVKVVLSNVRVRGCRTLNRP